MPQACADGSEDRVADRGTHHRGSRLAKAYRGLGAGLEFDVEFGHVGHAHGRIGVEVGIPDLPVDEFGPLVQCHARTPQSAALDLCGFAGAQRRRGEQAAGLRSSNSHCLPRFLVRDCLLSKEGLEFDSQSAGVSQKLHQRSHWTRCPVRTTPLCPSLSATTSRYQPGLGVFSGAPSEPQSKYPHRRPRNRRLLVQRTGSNRRSACLIRRNIGGGQRTATELQWPQTHGS